jgi:hypothetical protein
MRGLLLVLACAVCWPALAEEGMWTFDNFPVEAVRQTYGADIGRTWLEHVRLSTLRLANCSGAFVSPQGLILTNHHCIQQCLAELSSKERSLVQSGFKATARRDEERCLAQQADVLLDSEDVTAKVLKSTANKSETAANAARKKTLIELEQACQQGSSSARPARLKCQAVTLYQGGQFYLYKYKHYEDVRMVFAPEGDIAAYGGDPDNFRFPRWSLDFALLRAYENGAPAKTPNFLHIDFDGPQESELVFVAGHPGSTARHQTRAQLEFERSMSLPVALQRASELRGRYIQFGKTSAVNERIVETPLNSLQNIIKVRRYELDALNDPVLMAAKSDQEDRLRDSAHLLSPDPWEAIEAATQRKRDIYLSYVYLENGGGFNSVLFRDARWLVRGAEERSKRNDDRLREYTDGALPDLERELLARIPVFPEFEQLTLSFSLERMREWLGPDHPVVRKLLAHESPDALATRLVAETKLDDASLRYQLWRGGQPAVDASHDPMIELARGIDPEARAARRRYDEEVEAPIAAAAQRIAAARFKAYGTNIYPDATFTLRLNYGTVQGWVENKVPVPAVTHLRRAYERATGASPFRIPDSWLKVQDRLDMNTPFCISTSNDIIGGNSGSPLIDAEGRLVGLMFDGNLHSIAGRFWFNPNDNRAVALHPAIIREALDKVYGAHSLLAELAQ